MPPRPKALTESDVMRLPPMIWGVIRWPKGLGAPVGDAASGFVVTCQEHTATQFRIGPAGPEPIPGTGVWKSAVTVPCAAAPDEGNLHVVRFSVPGVHLNAFPDGKYRVVAELTGNWSESRIDRMLGYRRIDPPAWYVSLTKANHLVSVDFVVVHEAWRASFAGP
jgi:hypothetical protein